MQHLDGEGCQRVAQLLKQVGLLSHFVPARPPACPPACLDYLSVSTRHTRIMQLPSLRAELPCPCPLPPPLPTPPTPCNPPQLPYSSILVVAQAHSLQTQVFDATDVVVKEGGHSRVEQGSAAAVS